MRLVKNFAGKWVETEADMPTGAVAFYSWNRFESILRNSGLVNNNCETIDFMQIDHRGISYWIVSK